MAMTKVFLKDFLTIRRVKWCLVSVGVFMLVLNLLPLERYSSIPAANLLGIMVCFFPTMYTIYSYTTFGHVKNYLMLPVDSRKTILSYCLALFADTIVERIAFVVAAVVHLSRYPAPIVILLPISGFATVLANVVILLGMNSRRPVEVAAGFALFAGLAAACVWAPGLPLQLGCSVVVGAACLLLMLRHNSRDLAIQYKGTHSRRLAANYFVNVLFSEKMYILNTVLVLIIAGVFLFATAQMGNPLLAGIAWGIVCVNTPVTTMLSGDKDLIRQADMLPGRHGSIMGMYRSFLIVYYILAYGLVLAMSIIMTGRFEVYVAVQFAAAFVISVCGTLYLESKKRITNWQTKQQLWKNPRKYVVPAIVMLVCCAIGLLTTL